MQFFRFVGSLKDFAESWHDFQGVVCVCVKVGRQALRGQSGTSTREGGVVVTRWSRYDGGWSS